MKITPEELQELGVKKSAETYIEMRIKADVNDGDYIHSTNRINSVKEYLKLYAIACKIKSNGSHNWENCNDYLSVREIDAMSDYTPYMDNEQIHTIESISFTIVVDGVIYK